MHLLSCKLRIRIVLLSFQNILYMKRNTIKYLNLVVIIIKFRKKRIFKIMNAYANMSI